MEHDDAGVLSEYVGCKVDHKEGMMNCAITKFC